MCGLVVHLSSGLSSEGQLPDAEFSGLLIDRGSSIYREKNRKREMNRQARLQAELCYSFVNPHERNQMCETFYLVHALWYEFALTVDACERAVSGHLLQSIRNIARRRRATIVWLKTWRRSKRATNSLRTFIVWTEWSQVDEGVWLKSKSDLSHQPKWKVISEEE